MKKECEEKHAVAVPRGGRSAPTVDQHKQFGFVLFHKHHRTSSAKCSLATLISADFAEN